jgi:hypothetical protein
MFFRRDELPGFIGNAPVKKVSPVLDGCRPYAEHLSPGEKRIRGKGDQSRWLALPAMIAVV